MHGSTPDRTDDHLTVLVVEDEFLIALEVQTVLESAGHRVIGPATSVTEALRLIDVTRPDIAVLDVSLHGHSVAPVAERLAEIQVPFVVASAHRTIAETAGPLLTGAVNIGKPVTTQRLMDAVRSLSTLSRRR